MIIAAMDVLKDAFIYGLFMVSRGANGVIYYHNQGKGSG